MSPTATEPMGHGGVEVRRVFPRAHAEHDHHEPYGYRADGGEEEIALQALDGGFTPGQQRADRGEQHQKERDRDGYPIEERRADRDFVSLNPFGKDGEERSPQDGEADHKKEQIVEQETGFAGDQRFEFVLAFEVGQVLDQEEDANGGGQRDEDNEPCSDG